MKKLIPILTLIGVIIVIVLLLFVINTPIKEKVDGLLGGAFTLNEKTLMGSSSNLISPPISAVFENTTTTDSTTVQDPGTITQFVGTEGIENGFLGIQGISRTPTSSLYWIQTCSTDDTNFFDITSTTPALVKSTTTLGLGRQAYQLDFDSTTTTGKKFPVNVRGCKSTRFSFWGDDLSTDPTDGVQAWIRWIPRDKIR